MIRKSLILFFCLTPFFTSLSFAGSLVIFMKEDASGKHIWLSDENGKNLKRVTDNQDWNLYPDITHDGAYLAYVTGPSHEKLSLVVENKERSLRAVVSEEASTLHPSFSGDGNWLAWSEMLPSVKKEQIRILNFKAWRENGFSEKKEIMTIESEGKGYFPTLSSDGSMLVFQQSFATGKKNLVLVDLLTSERKELTAPAGLAMSPEFSFDDEKIVFTSQVDSKWNLNTIELSTLKVTQLTFASTEHNFAPHFTKEGDVLFASDKTGRFQLYLLKKEAASATGFSADATAFVLGEADFYAPAVSGNLDFSQTSELSFPAPSRSSFGAISHQGKIYLVGGHQGPEHTYPEDSFLSRVECYDLETKKWEELPPRSLPSHGFQIAAHGKYLYAFGGFAFSAAHKPSWKSLDFIERYDIEKKEWKIIGKMPRARSSYGLGQIGSKVYILGGWDSTPKSSGDLEGSFQRAIDVFDCETEIMTEMQTTLPDPLRRAFTAVETPRNTILLIGGLGVGSSHFELLDQVTEFDPATLTFSELPKLPFATFAPAAGILGGSLFVFGGMYKVSKYEYRYVNQIFGAKFTEHSLSAFQNTGRSLSESKGFSSVVKLGEKKLGILGGHHYLANEDAPVSTFETFGLLN